MKNWLHRIGMLCAVVGGLAFLAYALSSLRVADLIPYLTWRTLLALLAAALLYACTVPMSAWAWQRLLASVGESRSLRELNEILLTTQIGKYLPGNIGQHVGRIALALSRGIPSPALFVSIAYETLLLMLAGVLTALVMALLSPKGTAALIGHGDALGVATAIALAGLLLVPLLGRLLPAVIRRFLPKAGYANLDLRLGILPTLSAFFGYVMAYLLIGAGIGVLSASLSPALTQDFALLTAAFAIAWVVGFVTPGAPAGIGVREAVLTLILGGPLGAASAAVLIIALRVATTLGDILCLIAGLLLSARNKAGFGTPRQTHLGKDA
jgi:glycosyltransferase 2 family protein